MEPKILFEDDALVAIDKPSGMVANEAQSTSDLTVQKWFTDKYQIPKANNQVNTNNQNEFYEKGGIVHRLDKDTSGVMILAKNPETYEKLKLQFLERRTVKKYTALIHETFTDKHGEISQPIERHERDRKRFGIGKDLSRMAITEWTVLREYSYNNAKYSLMELLPHTGRTHQLRVHMQYMHHPIVSDPLYGYKKRWEEDLVWCPRLFLHAKYLEIDHPVTGKRIFFEAALASELEVVLGKLEKVWEV